MISASNIRPHQVNIINGMLELRKHGVKPWYFLVSGGIGTGKTSAICWLIFRWLLAWSGRYEKQDLIVAARTARQLRNVFISEWENQIPTNLYDLNRSDNVINMHSIGSKLYMHHSGKSQVTSKDASISIRGENRTGYVLNQAEEWPREFWDEAENRVRVYGVNSECHLKVFDCNGGNLLHWIYSTMINTDSDTFIGGNYLEKYSFERPGWKWKVYDRLVYLHIETTPKTSSYTKEWLELRKMILPENIYRKSILGEFCATEGLIYDCVEYVDNVAPSEISDIWAGHDPGTGYKREDDVVIGNNAIVFIGKRIVDGRYVVIDEYLDKFHSLDIFYKNVNDKISFWGREKFRYFVRDWTGLGKVYSSVLQDNGYMVLPPDGSYSSKMKEVSTGLILVYESFKTAMLLVCSKCENIIRDINNYAYDHRGLPNKVAYDPHLLDALRYAWIRVGRFEAGIGY